MCGIFGFTNFNTSELEKARTALNTLKHRGPDQWDDYSDDKVYMGHRRLSILDLSEHGKQPMISEDGNTIISVNGEIYNFKKIRDELSAKYHFRSTSDSEVVLHGYIEWGIDALLEKIDGMFAISIYDKKNKCIFLARDRSGIKPLFYSTLQKKVMWASELKPFCNFFEESNLKIDYSAVYDFFTYQYVPTPKTLYQEIFKLQPAHYLKVDLNTSKIEITQYWKLEVSEKAATIEEAKKQIYNLVEKSLQEQMVSDVPVGFFLSGGMDSSTVVGIATKFNTNTKTFTIGFANNPTDESHYADLVAEYFKTSHKKQILDTVSTNEMFGRIKEWYEEPFGDISCFPTYLVSKIAREKVIVVLTGDGGDEVFGGYKWYYAFKLIKKFNLRWLGFLKGIVSSFIKSNGIFSKLSKRAEWLFLNDLELYTRLMGGFLKHEKKDLKKAWNIPEEYDDYWYFRKYYRKDLKLITRLQYLDFHTYLHDDILAKVDRVSMSVSLECRVPLLSKEIIEYSFSLPEDVRIYKGNLKGAMKEAFSNLLPKEIINRDKQGFNVPAQTWRKELIGGYKSRHEKIIKEVFNIKF